MSGLIVIDGEKVELPDAKNKLAEAVRPHMPKAIRLLPSNEDRIQFASAVIVACNELDASKVTDLRSMLSSAIGAVRMGLMPGGEMGLCYFVPFKGRVTLVPGYRGFLYLATRNDYLRWVSTEVVYRGEEFRHWHDERGPHITHEIPLERSSDDREIIGAYCSYQTRNADAAVPVVINRNQIDKAKGTSQTDKVWRPHFGEMAMKTAIRRAAKRWNLTPQLAKAIQFDELAERGEPQPVELLDGVDDVPARRLPSLSDLPDPDEPVTDVEPEPAVEESAVPSGKSFRGLRNALAGAEVDSEVAAIVRAAGESKASGVITGDEFESLCQEADDRRCALADPPEPLVTIPESDLPY